MASEGCGVKGTQSHGRVADGQDTKCFLCDSGQVHDSLHKLDIRNLHVGKVTGTCSGIKLVGHKLACIAFSTKKLPDFYNNQSLQRAFGYSLA